MEQAAYPSPRRWLHHVPPVAPPGPGSTLDRLTCDRRLYHDLMAACLATFGRTNPLRYGCLVRARIYYIGVRLLGRGNYNGSGSPA